MGHKFCTISNSEYAKNFTGCFPQGMPLFNKRISYTIGAESGRERLLIESAGPERGGWQFQYLRAAAAAIAPVTIKAAFQRSHAPAGGSLGLKQLWCAAAAADGMYLYSLRVEHVLSG